MAINARLIGLHIDNRALHLASFLIRSWHFTGSKQHSTTQSADGRRFPCLWIPRSNRRLSTDAPCRAEGPVSLVWGKNLGSPRRRCRNIMAVLRNLLTFQPHLEEGVDGWPLYLAYGMLAYNKGTRTSNASLVCEKFLSGFRRVKCSLGRTVKIVTVVLQRGNASTVNSRLVGRKHRGPKHEPYP